MVAYMQDCMQAGLQSVQRGQQTYVDSLRHVRSIIDKLQSDCNEIEAELSNVMENHWNWMGHHLGRMVAQSVVEARKT